MILTVLLENFLILLMNTPLQSTPLQISRPEFSCRYVIKALPLNFYLRNHGNDQFYSILLLIELELL